MHHVTEWLTFCNSIAAGLLLPLTVWVVFSGLDDLLVDGAGLLAYVRGRWRGMPARRAVLRAPQQRIAVFVPCWQESGVIAAMVQRNRERVLYGSWDLFIGAYPNDNETVAIVSALGKVYPAVHLALCPHDGPTSKADCLNWIYQRMLMCESESGVRFDIITTHDAEDVIHPEALHWINWHARDHDMVQVPVLPLPTRLLQWTHGVYCDEFSEYQARDMPARELMGAFIPSNGVGTGFRRDALDRLAEDEGNRVFEPVCLTEDYENGLRLKLRGARQMFLPLWTGDVATREYFPRSFRAAVRQRTRWVTGIALQTWARHGWRGRLASRYWLWRDRKGLIGNPASLLTNVLFLYGLATWFVSCCTGADWPLERTAASLAPMLWLTATFGAYRVAYRTVCVGRSFGWVLAAGAPLRTVLANLINSVATVHALWRFSAAMLRCEPLRWIKTEHQYPSPSAFAAAPLRIGELLVRDGYIRPEDLTRALASVPAGVRLGEHLVALGCLDEDALYEALSLQSGLPHDDVESAAVSIAVARCLPARIARAWQLVPVRAESGELLVASPEIPGEGIEHELRAFTGLRPRFCLITPGNYRRLVEALL